MATEEEFRLAKFKIYGLLFSPGRGVDGLSLTDPDPGDSSALSSDIAAHSSSASDVTSASASASGDGASANKAVEKKKSGKRRRWRFTKVKENKPAAPNGKAVKEAKSPKQRTAKASSSSATSSGGSTRAAAADDDADEAHTHSRSETLSEYSYEVVDEEEDDEDEWETDEAAIQRLARSGEANGPRLLRVFYDDDLYKTFAVDLHTTAAEIIREGGEKLHLRSGAVQFALFLIRDNEDIRRLMPNERPGLLLCQYAKRNDIKFAFLSTMGRFNTAMRNRTFRAWINWKLSLLACDELIEVPSVRSFLDFADGIVILHLLEALGFPLPSKYHKRPSKDKHRLENIDTALQCCRKAGCVFPDQVSARAILLRDPMIASDFVWSIIYRVQAPLVTNSHLEFQFIDELLFWCQKNLDTYKTIRAHKLMDCLCDGLAFCALIHRFRESALNYNMVEYTHQNLHRKNSVTAQVAVDAAEREFSIPALLQPADFDAPQVDELSVIISLSVYMQILEKKQVPPPVPFAERLRLQPHTPAGGAQLGEPAMSREDIKRLSKEERERKKRDKDDLKRRKEEEKRLERDGSAACKETGEVVAVAASASNSSSGSLTDVASLSSSTGTLSGSMLGSPTVPHQPVKRKDGLKTIPVFFQGFSNSFRSFQTILVSKHQTVSETYELIASENDLSVSTFVLIQQRKQQTEVELEVDDETRLFKERGLGRYLICERRQQGQRTFTVPLCELECNQSTVQQQPSPGSPGPGGSGGVSTSGSGERDRRSRRKRGSIFLRKKKKDEVDHGQEPGDFPSDFSELAALIRAEADAHAAANAPQGDTRGHEYKAKQEATTAEGEEQEDEEQEEP